MAVIMKVDFEAQYVFIFHSRYNEGVSDLKGNSIVVGGEPRIFFKETALATSVTRYSFFYTFILFICIYLFSNIYPE